MKVQDRLFVSGVSGHGRGPVGLQQHPTVVSGKAAEETDTMQSFIFASSRSICMLIPAGVNIKLKAK